MMLTVHEASARVGLTVRQLYRLAETGRLACVRTDGRVLTRQIAGRLQRYRKAGRLLFLAEDLDAWVVAHRDPGRAVASPATLTDYLPRRRQFA